MNRWKDYRDAQRGGPPRDLDPCGTLAAVRRHERAKEPLCDACRQARNAKARELYAARHQPKGKR